MAEGNHKVFNYDYNGRQLLYLDVYNKPANDLQQYLNCTHEEAIHILQLIEAIPNSTDYRFQGKILNFSVIYGKTEQGLSDDLKCSVEEAAKVLHSYFSKYYKLKEWLDMMAKQGSRNKRIRLPTGRILWVDEANSKGNNNSSERKAGNGGVQGLCADQLKMTLPPVRKYLEEINDRYNIRNSIVALVHKLSNCAH